MNPSGWILIGETNRLEYVIITEKKRGKIGEKSFPKSGGNFAESIFREINRFATADIKISWETDERDKK